MKSYIFSFLVVSAVLGNCQVFAHNHQNRITVTVTSGVINAGYLGNGAEWDPYDEAESWGASVSDEDWEKLFKRVDFMRMRYVRCMINSPYRYFDARTGKYDKTRNIKSISKLLDYCTRNHITVIFGEYNPPTWAMKQDDRWVEMSVDYLNYLVNDLGFSCIKYFIIFNEPDGDWASTNGDYQIWRQMAQKFAERMKQYPGLPEKVKLAAPDVVADYKNRHSPYNSEGWMAQAVNDLDSLVGIYDIHAYPGQFEVRSGEYMKKLASYKKLVSPGKKIVLGEAGYKYWRSADSLLMAEYKRRVQGHPFTKGSDCNMLVYDYFYGLDMPLLCMDVMNSGYSGMAVWMLDDAMHTNGDSGIPQDVKIWGMWNILGREVFGKPEEENIRPWYYTWSLMCRYFQTGANILRCKISDNKNIRVVVAEFNGKMAIAAVNFGNTDYQVDLRLPVPMKNCRLYIYREDQQLIDVDGLPVPVNCSFDIGKKHTIGLEAQSFILLTDME